MKKLALALLLLTGCQTPDVTTIDQSVEVVASADKLTRPYKIIGQVSDDGTGKEKFKIQEKMTKVAKKKGADFIIFANEVSSGSDLVGFQVVQTYTYKAEF